MEDERTIRNRVLISLLESFSFRFQNEKELQDGIAKVLDGETIEYKREFSLSRWDRPDFLIEGIAIEVKIGGTLNNLLRQIHRYAGFEEIEAVIVITNRSRLADLPAMINGKQVSVILLRGGF